MSECSRSALVVKRHTSQIASIFSSNRARIASFSVAASIPSVSTTSVANEPPPVHAVSASCSAAHAPTCGGLLYSARGTVCSDEYCGAHGRVARSGHGRGGMGGEAWAGRHGRRTLTVGSEGCGDGLLPAAYGAKQGSGKKWDAEVLCKPPAWPMC